MRLLSKCAEETFTCGFKLGSLLKKGTEVCLYGELGAGKTTFTKGVASALGIPEHDITSASFTIIAEYEGKQHGLPVPFYHIDLYRLGEACELETLGIEDYIGKGGISVIEWAERLGSCEDAITVSFEILDGEERAIVIEGMNETDWDNMQDRQA